MARVVSGSAEDALAGLAPERPERRSEPGDAAASLGSDAGPEATRNGEEGRGLGGGASSPVQENLAATQLRSFGDDISFDPSILDGQGDPSISPCPKTITGSEDWLSVNFHVNFEKFDDLAKQLDAAQESALKGIEGSDVVQFKEVRFLVAPRGARQGSGDKSIYMRWRLTAENGLVVLLMNRGESHTTMPNASARATSLLLMRMGFGRVWDFMQYCIEAMGGTIVGNKLSRVDPCADLAGTDIAEFVEPFNQGWIVSRSRTRANYAVGTFVNDFLQGKRHTGFTIGKSPLLCRIYNKLLESERDPQKLAVLSLTRWSGLPKCATRVEFQIERAKLKQFGIDTVENWIGNRSEVIDELTQNWLRLTAGPIDRKHANRSPMHPVWEKTRDAFFAWCGNSSGQELVPLPKLSIDSSRQVAMVVGIFKGMFARIGKDITDNEKFFREVEFAIRDGVGTRDMAAEVERKALELGASDI